MKRTSFVRAAGLGVMSLAAAPAQATQDRTAVTDPSTDRAATAYTRRVAAAAADRAIYNTSHANGDEQRYADRGHLGSFTKLLPHDDAGVVIASAYATWQSALQMESPAGLAALHLPPRVHELIAYAYTDDAQISGIDPRGITVPAAPRLDSARTAAETVELYWLALARDISFFAYATDPTIAQACAELAPLHALSVAAPPTPETIFRGPAGALTGPHVSQFLWRDIPLDLYPAIVQRHDFPVAGTDFLTTRAIWLAAQNGSPATTKLIREGRLRYLATGRDLADYVMRSSPANVWRSAAAIIDGLGPDAVTSAFDYDDFCCLLGLTGNVSSLAMMHQKFAVHRRVRPEELGGLLDRDRSGAPIHQTLRHAAVLDRTRARTGTLLLPQAYVRGCPPHSAYPAGHATSAGAGATLLKALVNPAYPLLKPVIATADGTELIAYTGAPLTLGGEIEKLAANYAYGRGTAGVHFRSDSDAGLRLGEAAAISVLRDRATVAGKGFTGFHFRSFDGEAVDIH